MENNVLSKYTELSEELRGKLIAVHAKINNFQENLSDIQDAEDIAEIREDLKD